MDNGTDLWCGFNIVGGMKVNFPERPETAMEDMREVGQLLCLELLDYGNKLQLT